MYEPKNDEQTDQQLNHIKKTFESMQDLMSVRYAKDISEQKSVEKVLQMREKQQAVVAKLGQEELAGVDIDTLMEESVRLVSEALDVEYCRIIEHEDGTSTMIASVGWDENDEIKHENENNGIFSRMDVQIGCKEKQYGTMNICTRQRRVFTKEDVNFVQSVANVLAEALSRKQTEENFKGYTKELEDTNYLKVLFTDILTHDILNPANTIRGFAEEMILIENDDNKKKMLHKIHSNNEKLISMIESASKFIKLESINDLRFEKQDFSPLLEKVIKSLGYELGKKRIRLYFNPKRNYPSLINPLIEEVFLNLLSNAIKYSPMSGKIIIDVTDEGNMWKILISDEGPGICTKDKDIIFERYRQADKGSIKGSGLGLAIVKRIVELHGGEVGVENNPAGSGSIFWFTLKKAHS